ncbi:MAG: redox-active protein [Spirochaetaceae bacterium]|nr:MAG: redox-active protein [Spirochaetaceae bacterium]
MSGQTLYGIVAAGLNKREDLNCAETILYAANQAYGLELEQASLRLAAGFGGGMGVESTCGVLTGASMVFSAMFVQQRGHESDRVKQLNAEFFQRMRGILGHIDCAPIKERWRHETDGCLPVMLEAARVLQQIVDRERAVDQKPPS